MSIAPVAIQTGRNCVWVEKKTDFLKPKSILLGPFSRIQAQVVHIQVGNYILTSVCSQTHLAASLILTISETYTFSCVRRNSHWKVAAQMHIWNPISVT